MTMGREPYLDVGEFLRRCKREGRYDEVKARQCEYYGRSGMSKKNSWKRVMQEYPPLPVTELVGEEDVDAALDDLGEYLVEPVLGELDEKSLAGRMPGYMVWLDRNIGRRLNLDDPAPSALCLYLWKVANKPEYTAKVLDIVRDNIPPAKLMESGMKMQDDGGDVLDTIARIRGAKAE